MIQRGNQETLFERVAITTPVTQRVATIHAPLFHVKITKTRKTTLEGVIFDMFPHVGALVHGQRLVRLCYTVCLDAQSDGCLGQRFALAAHVATPTTVALCRFGECKGTV